MEIGFEIYPPLKRHSELISWSTFIIKVSESFEIEDALDRIIIDGVEILKDGYYVRQVPLPSLVELARESFDDRVFPLGSHYSEKDVVQVTQEYLCMRQSQITLTEPTDSRHCAYCLLGINDVLTCSGCDKRVYCSAECQLADWKPCSAGQGHKNWCKLNCGEEDLDWKVDANTGGLIAKRTFPAMSKIMVDAQRPLDHPGIMDLMPLNGTLLEKITLNTFGCNVPNSVCLRISRVNHACDANACLFVDPKHHVVILFAQRDIQPGDEITVQYTLLYNLVSADDTDPIGLLSKYDIVCDQDCFCQDRKHIHLTERGRKLNSKIQALIAKGQKSGAASGLRAAHELLDIQKSLNVSWLDRAKTYHSAFQIACLNVKTRHQATDFIKNAYEIVCAISSPSSELALAFELDKKSLVF